MTTPFEPTDADSAWIAREYGKYRERKPVWIGEDFWTGAFYNRDHAASYHYPHRSDTDPNMLAYTPSPEYGRVDRQVRIKPGRYLAKHFGDVLTEKQIQFYAQWWATGARPADPAFAKAAMKLATTEDAVADVYLQGPHSCMTTQFERDDHPTRVYAAGDLAVAYLEIPSATPEEDGRIIARALVWPDRKVFGRVYPSETNWSRDGFESYAQAQAVQAMLFNRLKAEGFKHVSEGGSFNGARLLKIENGDGDMLMPYLDNDYGVNDAGSFWKMDDENPDHQCQETEGVLEPQNRFTCDRCEDSVPEDEAHTVYTRWTGRYASGEHQFCSYCYENHTFYCDGAQETFSDYCDRIEARGRTYLQQWAERNGFYQSDRSGDWFDDEHDPRITTRDGDTVAESEVEPGDLEDEDEGRDEDEDEDEDSTPAPVARGMPHPVNALGLHVTIPESEGNPIPSEIDALASLRPTVTPTRIADARQEEFAI